MFSVCLWVYKVSDLRQVCVCVCLPLPAAGVCNTEVLVFCSNLKAVILFPCLHE